MPAISDTRSANPLLRSSEGQTYLIGDEVYLRPPAPADADVVVSWKHTRFPISPDRIRSLIDKGETGDDSGKDKTQLIIVRRADDRPVGSIVIHTGWFPFHYMEAVVDPIFGADGERWKGEGVAMAMRLVVDEWQKPIAEISMRADETAVIERLEAIGARECKRFRELYARDGVRVDSVDYEYLNAHWVERLGDPADVEQPRSGTGEPRPVTPPVLPEGDPPANAIRIGPRVYLRPPQESDARTAAHWSTRESDTNWDNGRYPGSSGGWWKWMGKLQKETPPEWVRFAVCLRDNDELIGFVGISDIDYRHRYAESESEIINPAYRGAGYGSEAKHLMFDYAFNTLGLHVLVSWVFYRNTRSAAALRKQGYRDAGRTSWVTQREGVFVNMGNFDLLADEWRAMPRREPGASE